MTQMDHHSNIVPWWLEAKDRGFHLRFWPITPSGELDLKDLEAVWSDRVRVVALPHVSNVLGTVNPIPAIASFVHQQGAFLVVDAAQSVGHGPFDVSHLGCDAAAFSAHKMYGPMGIGVLWVREEVLSSLVPYQGGGEMIATVSETEVTFNEPPYRFEAGTPPCGRSCRGWPQQWDFPRFAGPGIPSGLRSRPLPDTEWKSWHPSKVLPCMAELLPGPRYSPSTWREFIPMIWLSISIPGPSQFVPVITVPSPCLSGWGHPALCGPVSESTTAGKTSIDWQRLWKAPEGTSYE